MGENFPLQREMFVISLSAWLRTLCSNNVWPLAESREANATVLRVKYSRHFWDKALCLPPRKDSKAPTVAQISEQIGSGCWTTATAYLMRRTQPHFHSPEQASGWGRGCQRDSAQILLAKMLSLCHMASFARLNGVRVHITSWHLHNLRPPYANALLCGMQCHLLSCLIPLQHFLNHALPARCLHPGLRYKGLCRSISPVSAHAGIRLVVLCATHLWLWLCHDYDCVCVCRLFACCFKRTLCEE